MEKILRRIPSLEKIFGITLVEPSHPDWESKLWCRKNATRLWLESDFEFESGGINPVSSSLASTVREGFDPKHPEWLWCVRCERAFSILTSTKRKPDKYSLWDHWADLKLQLGIIEFGGTGVIGYPTTIGSPRSAVISVKCHYSDCSASLNDFWWWDSYRKLAGKGKAPEKPSLDIKYPLRDKETHEVAMRELHLPSQLPW